MKNWLKYFSIASSILIAVTIAGVWIYTTMAPMPTEPMYAARIYYIKAAHKQPADYNSHKQKLILSGDEFL